jgi:TonB family protein
MPDRMRMLALAGLSCLVLARGVCQDNPRVPVHRATASPSGGSLEHYRLGEQYLQQTNYQSAANEFRAALNGDHQQAWTVVWSHIQLARIFDATGQQERALNEYRQAARTGDNTNGALVEANNYLERAGQARYPALHGLSVEPIQATDPEYTEEARIAGLEGTVVLGGVIDEVGFAQNLEVLEPLGLGLDEKAIEAVKQWHFDPRQRPPVQIAVDFRLPSKQSRWHLIQVQFDNLPGTKRPVFVNALYPIGAGIGPEAMEEGRLVAAMGRLATAKVRFEVNELGLPSHFSQMPNASEPIWGSEATALLDQWRFTPGTRNGIAVPVACTVELVWGERDLNFSKLEQVHQAMNEQMAAPPAAFPLPVAEPGGMAPTGIGMAPEVQATKLVIRIPPEYPPAARASGLQGTVRLRLLIGADGHVRDTEVMDGDPALTAAAADAVKQWVYQPTLLNGAPVEVTTEADVDVGTTQ